MKKQIVIIGAGISGEIIGREIVSSNKAILIGYLDDNHQKKGLTLNGKPIFGDTSLIPKLLTEHKIDKVIISIPSAEGKIIKDILKKLIHTDIQIQIVPGYYHILDQDIKIDYPIRDIDISDLLGRPQVKIDIQNIASYLTQKKVLITGAGGSIGRELAKLIASVDPESLILLGRGENSIFQIVNELNHLYPTIKTTPKIVNITNYLSLEEVFQKYKPDVVFHAAAHKHVHLMESHVKEAFRNNVIGSNNLMELSQKHDVKRFVLISTDKAVRPKSVMGVTKRITELLMAYYSNPSSRTSYPPLSPRKRGDERGDDDILSPKSNTIFCAVRFGNVLGSSGSVLPLFKDQIKRGGPVTVVHKDVVRYFMTIPEASQLVLQAGGIAQGREIFILNMGEPIQIYELAKLLIQLYNTNPVKSVEIKITGLRPGEKLVEELWTPSEETIISENKEIYVVYPQQVSFYFLELINTINNDLNMISNEEVKKRLFAAIQKSPQEIVMN